MKDVSDDLYQSAADYANKVTGWPRGQNEVERAHAAATGITRLEDPWSVAVRTFVAVAQCIEANGAANAPANEVSNAERAQYEITIRQQQERIRELEGYRVSLTNLAAQYQGERDAARAQASRLDVDGKTPGQIAYEAWNDCGAPAWPELSSIAHAWWEAVGSAVLRAFGNGAEALKRVRGRIVVTGAYPLDIIDAEIANIERVRT